MGFKITNLTEVSTMFRLLDREVPALARATLIEGAKKIRNTAISFAPVDKHNLEKAIHLLPFQGNQYSLRIIIDVGGVVGGRSVDEYATIVHEYPWSKRGPLTRIKGPRAGPRYLSRAMDVHKALLVKDLQKAMQTGISTAVNRSGVNRGNRSRRR